MLPICIYVIHKDISINNRMLCNVLTDFMESNEDTWVYFTGPRGWYTNDKFLLVNKIWATAHIIEDNSGEETSEHSFGVEQVVSGWTKLVDEHPRIAKAIEQGEYDIADADIFLQYCLLGEEVFS